MPSPREAPAAAQGPGSGAVDSAPGGRLGHGAWGRRTALPGEAQGTARPGCQAPLPTGAASLLADGVPAAAAGAYRATSTPLKRRRASARPAASTRATTPGAVTAPRPLVTVHTSHSRPARAQRSTSSAGE
jgi:hypothetical protein